MRGSPDVACHDHGTTRWSWGAPDHGYAEVCGRASSEGSIQDDEFALCGLEAGSESLDLAEPTVAAGFVDPVGEIAGDLDKAGTLLRVNAKHGAANTGVLMLARGAVWAAAGA